MSAYEQNRLHSEAAEHYYDLVAKREAAVPESIVRHVCGCLFCRVQVRCLEETLAGTRSEAHFRQAKMDTNIVDTLNFHFRHLGERVTCAQVKPFLPTLLIPSRRVRIPTPVTVHVDHCRACTEDLGAIRVLNLEPGQLERLGRLYAQDPGAEPSRCGTARLKIPAFAAAAVEGIDRELLNHLSTCPRCRVQVYEHRQKLLAARRADSAQAGPNGCRTVTMADIFDYVVAYDLASGEGEEPGRTKRPAGAHVRGCRFCLDKIQILHRIMYGIAERPESGVATVYRTVEGAKDAPAPGDPYPTYPITVEVIHRQVQPAATRRRRSAAFAGLNSTAFHPRTRSLLFKAAVVALVALPLALLFRGTTSAAGITLGRIVKAFGKAENVHVSRFYPPTGELLQELWISRARDIVVVTKGQECTLYDLAKEKKHVYSAAETTADVTELNDREYANARRLVDGCLGFTLADVPTDATWNRIEDDIIEGAEVYELVYRVRDRSGTTIFLKRTIVIDPLTQLPQEILAFNRLRVDGEWTCESRRVLEYPSESETAAVVEQ